jgi:hypothetical protein
VKHTAEQSHLMTDTKRTRDELLGAQRELDAKNTETTLLYVALALMIAASAAIWIYRRFSGVPA